MLPERAKVAAGVSIEQLNPTDSMSAAYPTIQDGSDVGMCVHCVSGIVSLARYSPDSQRAAERRLYSSSKNTTRSTNKGNPPVVSAQSKTGSRMEKLEHLASMSKHRREFRGCTIEARRRHEERKVAKLLQTNTAATNGAHFGGQGHDNGSDVMCRSGSVLAPVDSLSALGVSDSVEAPGSAVAISALPRGAQAMNHYPSGLLTDTVQYAEPLLSPRDADAKFR